jgi:hypothetical protein
MLGELYTEISNRLATFVKEWENLENDEVRPSNRLSRTRKYARALLRVILDPWRSSLIKNCFFMMGQTILYGILLSSRILFAFCWVLNF